MSLALIFEELSDAIERYGRAPTISAEVRAVIDRHDLLVIDRSDGLSAEIDFGVRRGDESIIGHFILIPGTGSTPAHVAYDVDWNCPFSAPGVPDVEARSWEWPMALGPVSRDDEPEFTFPTLQ